MVALTVAWSFGAMVGMVESWASNVIFQLVGWDDVSLTFVSGPVPSFLTTICWVVPDPAGPWAEIS